MKKILFFFITALIILAGCSVYRAAKLDRKFGPVQTVESKC